MPRLQDRETSNSEGIHAQDIEEHASDHLGNRHGEIHNKRLWTLAGSALVQLPIWGFAMSFGVFQEYFNTNWGSVGIKGDQSRTGLVAALCGAGLACISFTLSSFSTVVWQLILTQGVMAAFGCTLMFSPMTLSLGECYSTGNRALAYGITLSCKNIVGSVCPFLFRQLIDHYGFRVALRAWAAIGAGTSTLAILLVPTYPPFLSTNESRQRRIPWQFLKHKTFHIYSLAIILQSAGYGIPQTYLSEFAREVALLSQTSATLLLTLFNIPGIASSSFFGYLSDNKHIKLSANTVTSVSAFSSALSAFLLWGLTSRGDLALLLVFSMTFGFFAGGYSATWGGVLADMEREAAQRNEAIDTGMVYGLFNGARGVGYVVGGLASVSLLEAGSTNSVAKFAYDSSYGPLIIFSGLCSLFGGWGVLWRWDKLESWLKGINRP
ncbi:hypothetical protein LTR64_001465 [Lithohypha guttulata]|uniref:MFS general substrate transporter n=1 Tax=Lithohypha guttulata TaxID=1690604 RepID=A0AAN7Y915_9EURO|nr:hypothetical protein LTR51_003659 [Lithohypha guttulata]KAK5082165.1 hypothetical protein LTR05_007308 [Lithohypha guttulata]